MKYNILIYSITFLVAFCSIVYELIFSQVLTVIFGGTVLRYSITIGLYLFSLGIGAFLFQFVKQKNIIVGFYKIELALSLLGPLGVFFIIIINSISFAFISSNLFQLLLLMFSHIPILLVGILSGMEIPYLSRLIQQSKNPFSKILGFDYMGSLFGTIVYALLMYPFNGLISTVFIIGFINLIVAIIFYNTHVKNKIYTFHIIGIILSLVYIFVLSQSTRIQERITQLYIGVQIKHEFWFYGLPVSAIKILDHFYTPYQSVTLYSLQYPDDFSKDYSSPSTCLSLDLDLQLCEKWVEPSHKGLVDIPLAFMNERKNPNVLLIGGGDWITINYLKDYGASIDHVDIDKKFMDYTKSNKFFAQFHKHSYRYERLQTYVEDAFYFVKNNKKQYDLIILDLPGLVHDKLLHLYSIEFFTFINKSLHENGLIATWSYDIDSFPVHHKAFMNTVRKAGFKNYMFYKSFLKGKEYLYIIQNYFLFSKNDFKPRINLSVNKYVEEFKKYYTKTKWEKIPYFDNIKSNTIFAPNLQMIISHKKVKMPEYSR